MKVGEVVDDFEAHDQADEVVRLSGLLAHGPVVLFFYPRAMTRGCTAESCHFRDLASEFATLGATRVGISADLVERQSAFADKHDLDYPLLSDPDRRLARRFGVNRPGPIFNRRATFVIDTDFHIVEVITSEVDMNAHADRALDALRRI